MQIHRVKGRNLEEALARAKRLVGAEAVVLSRETGADGAVTLSVGAEPPGPVERLERYGFSEARGAAGRRSSERELSPALRDVRTRMRRHGASSRWIEDICGRLGPAARGVHAIDRAARLIGSDFEGARANKVAGRTRVIALIGPTGVGKTTTIAKLCDRMTGRGRRVALASIDDYRAGALDQLRAFAEALQVPFHAPRSLDALETVMRGVPPVDAILLDTTGRSPSDGRELAQLARHFEHIGREGALCPYLVQSAAASRSSLAKTHAAFSALEPQGVIVTKLDETDEPAAALEYVRDSKLPLAFLCDGQDIGLHLHRPTPDNIADLVLRGHLA